MVVFKAFSNGYFTIKKTTHVFSTSGRDKANQENNQVVKIEGGSSFNNETMLFEGILAGPFISDRISESK